MTPLSRRELPSVLVVEDDAVIVANLVDYLQQQGHRVGSVHDGDAAIERLASDTYDVIVLDIGLPRVDGMAVLDHLRRTLGLATPVLILSARNTVSSKVESLSLGADDYLTKPFVLAEVEARILALHRRAGRRDSTRK
jgi:DNA-binding response OmpR family regulator